MFLTYYFYSFNNFSYKPYKSCVPLLFTNSITYETKPVIWNIRPQFYSVYEVFVYVNTQLFFKISFQNLLFIYKYVYLIRVQINNPLTRFTETSKIYESYTNPEEGETKKASKMKRWIRFYLCTLLFVFLIYVGKHQCFCRSLQRLRDEKEDLKISLIV